MEETAPNGGEHHDHIDLRGSEFRGPVTGKVVINHCHCPVLTALSALPAAPAGFTGRRTELTRLLDVLCPADSRTTPNPAVICAVTGLGGMGKTALALDAAHTACARKWFPGGTLFIDLGGYDDTPVTADQAVTSLLHALGVGHVQLPSDDVDQYALYRSRLANLADQDQPVLLLLDNASTSEQVSPLLPGSDRHRVLITSRERLDSLPARQLALEALSPDNAVSLIATALRLRDPDDDRPSREAGAVRDLAQLCGHLPLGLQIAAALLRRRPNRPIASLVDELRTATDTTRALVSEGVDQYSRSLALAPVFDVSFGRLGADQAGMLRAVALAPSTEISTDAAAAMAGLSPAMALRLLDDLVHAHLITEVEASTGTTERWRIHDLVRGYTATLTADDPALAEEGALARERLLSHYSRLAEAADRQLRFLQGDPVPEVFAGRAAALAWLDAERVNLVAAAQWTDDRYAPAAVRLALSVAEFLRWRRFFDDGIAVGRAARDAAHRLEDPHSEATVCNNLGGALLRAERADEAIEPLTRAAGLFDSIGDRTGEGMAWNNLGLALRRTDQVEEAINNHVRARDRFHTTGDLHLEGRAWHNLGLSLDTAGRTDQAIDAFARACEIHRATGDRVLHGDSLNSLGWALHAAGRAEEAIAAYHDAVKIRQEYDNWYATGQTLNNLALALKTANRPDDAAKARAEAVNASARAGTTAEVYGHLH
ncbi:tetratricopeptide repeat protein [Streptomyces xylophagus]|uniref:tetratricopeptide repeat protein n=1 Tax=Streptomyces xylophagus TaxID=285514 RepID=UPI000A9FF7EC|nr:tetratricopeptide repeat protein [Streptomyces xylophagus]